MTNRDAHLDNAKGVLIILVVTGHLFWPLPPGSAVDEAVYTWIYAFHMPTFALISGYLSPVRNGPLTHLGRHSLTIYLLHSPLLLVYRQHAAVHDAVNQLPMAAIVAVGIAVSVVLGSTPLTRVTRWLTRPDRWWRSLGPRGRSRSEPA